MKKPAAKKPAKKVVKKPAAPVFEIVPDSELLAMACEFDMGNEPILNGRYKWWEEYPAEARTHHIYIKNMGNPDGGPDRWGIFKEGNSTCLNKNGEWQWQSMPSNREKDFYEHCRYASLHEAIGYYRKWRAAIAAWAEERMEKAKKQDSIKRTILNYEDCPNIPKF